MIIESNLLKEIQTTIRLADFANFISIANPYTIQVSKQSESFSLKVNPNFLKKSWLFQILILSIGGTLHLISLHQETLAFNEKATKLVISLLLITLSYSVYCHMKNGNDYAFVINSLENFERNVLVHLKSKPSRKTYISHTNIELACQLFSLAIIIQPLVYSVSCVLFPEVPWNILSTFNFMISEYNLSIFGKAGLKIGTMVLNYILIKVFTNYAAINVVVHLLIPTFCIKIGLHLIERYTESNIPIYV